MKFSHILCDWPWWYSNRLSGKGRTKFGSGAPGKYHVERVTAAPEFPVWDLADPDGCLLHFWCTGPHLFDAKEVFDAWGFTYTTYEFTWVKTVIPRTPKKLKEMIDEHGMMGMLKHITRRGPGHYTASNAEFVLLGWKNRPLTNTEMRHQTIFAAPGTHSRKPFHIHHYIDKVYPGSNCIELFAVPDLWTESRQSPNNWEYLGFEVDGRDLRDSIPELARA